MTETTGTAEKAGVAEVARVAEKAGVAEVARVAEKAGVVEMAGTAEVAGIAEVTEVAHHAPVGHSTRPRRVLARVRGISGSVARRVAAGGDRGMATAEYAIATIAAVGFAGLLIVVLRSGEVRELLMGIIRGALST